MASGSHRSERLPFIAAWLTLPLIGQKINRNRNKNRDDFGVPKRESHQIFAYRNRNKNRDDFGVPKRESHQIFAYLYWVDTRLFVISDDAGFVAGFGMRLAKRRTFILLD